MRALLGYINDPFVFFFVALFLIVFVLPFMLLSSVPITFGFGLAISVALGCWTVYTTARLIAIFK